MECMLYGTLKSGAGSAAVQNLADVRGFRKLAGSAGTWRWMVDERLGL
jgi:hypothetical protein